jgi:hypothetical protein
MKGADYEDMPAIAISQWRSGRTLSDADVAMIQRLLREHEEDLGCVIDSHAQARENALREIGGQKLVDMMDENIELVARIAFEKAVRTVAARRDMLENLQSTAPRAGAGEGG